MRSASWSRWRRRQRHPLRRRAQLPTYPRLAEGSFAPNPDHDPVSMDQPISAHSGFLTDDQLFNLGSQRTEDFDGVYVVSSQSIRYLAGGVVV